MPHSGIYTGSYKTLQVWMRKEENLYTWKHVHTRVPAIPVHTCSVYWRDSFGVVYACICDKLLVWYLDTLVNVCYHYNQRQTHSMLRRCKVYTHTCWVRSVGGGLGLAMCVDIFISMSGPLPHSNVFQMCYTTRPPLFFFFHRSIMTGVVCFGKKSGNAIILKVEPLCS